jgi:hypothetical protein
MVYLSITNTTIHNYHTSNSNAAIWLVNQQLYNFQYRMSYLATLSTYHIIADCFNIYHISAESSIYSFNITNQRNIFSYITYHRTPYRNLTMRNFLLMKFTNRQLMLAFVNKYMYLKKECAIKPSLNACASEWFCLCQGCLLWKWYTLSVQKHISWKGVHRECDAVIVTC